MRFQFTHPGGVRLATLVELGKIDAVSIHAPGRGATVVCWHIGIARKVSIHAPGRGATHYNIDDFNADLMFQFTHPGGVRLVPDSDYSAVGMFQFTHPGGVRRIEQ